MLAEELQNEDNDDIVLLESGRVDAGELARTALILGMDTKTLCSEDCKGLCPRCGANLNDGPCGCKGKLTRVWRSWQSFWRTNKKPGTGWSRAFERSRRCHHGSTQGKSIKSKTR